MREPVPDEWFYASVDLSADTTTVAAFPCLVKGWEITTTMSAHICLLKDGSTTVAAIPASTTAGTGVDYLGSRRYETSLVVDPDNAATGVITVYYRALGSP